jgi:putative oxidoreductase
MIGVEAFAYLAARVFTCGIWVSACLHGAMHYKDTAQVMTMRGIPASRLVLAIVLAMEAVGTVLLLANVYVWAVCLAWGAFLIPASYLYHRKWVTPQGAFDMMQYVQFWKNVSMFGGLIAIILLDPSRPAWLLRG